MLIGYITLDDLAPFFLIRDWKGSEVERINLKRHQKHKKSSMNAWIDKSAFYVMMLPGILILLAFEYAPKFGLVLAFKNYRFDKGIWGSDWCGLHNFKYFFKTPDAWIITRNTVLYNIVFIFLGTVLAIALAIALNELTGRFSVKIYQTVLLMPHFLSYVVVAYLVFSFLSMESGVLNRTILPLLGIEPINWYGEAEYWPVILTTVKMWKTVGYSSIVYLAAIVGIDPCYYEAAQMDGASKWQQMRHITLPGIKTMISIQLIMAFGGIFNSDFGLFYQVTKNSGMIKSTTAVLSTYIYNVKNDVSFATAAGFYVSIVGLLMVLAVNGIVRIIDEENSLF